jgi:hypothetical protein
LTCHNKHQPAPCGLLRFWSRDLPADDLNSTDQRGGKPMKLEVPTQYGEERRGWHFDKTINISVLLAIVPAMISVLIWATTVETRFTATIAQYASLERQVVTDKLERDRQRTEDRQATQATLIDLQQQIRAMDARVSDKLDRISDKVGARR